MSVTAPLRRLNELPGPPGLPVLGNILSLDFSRLHQVMEDWSRAYGPIYRIRLGTADAMVVSDSTLIAQVLRDRPERFRRGTLLTEVFEEIGLVGVFPAEGEDWRRQRQIWMKALNAQRLRTFHQGLHEVTGRLLKRWRGFAATAEAFDVQADLMRYTVDVTMRFALGYDANTLEQEGDVIQQHLDKIFPAIGRRLTAAFPYWRWFKLSADRELDRALAGVWAEVGKLIDAARARMAQRPELRDNPTCLLEAMLVAHDAEGVALGDRELFGNTLGALLAGEDTTANTLSWMIYFIAQHASVQQRLQAEADTVLATCELCDAAEMERLTYVDAVMNESLRLKPVAPFMGVECNEDVQLGGVQLRRGTRVFVLPRIDNLDPDEFAEPQSFQPERRWSGTHAHAVKPGMPFGFGPRICPGRHLAVTEIRAVTSMLARNFEVELARPAEAVRERLAFTMTPVGLRVRLRPRR